MRTWHIAIPAVVGGISIPVALFMGTPVGTVAVITITACAIFAALPNFWTIPAQFLTGAAAAAGIALINTVGNFAGFAAGYITGVLKDWTGSYVIPMFLVKKAFTIGCTAPDKKPKASSIYLEPWPKLKA